MPLVVTEVPIGPLVGLIPEIVTPVATVNVELGYGTKQAGSAVGSSGVVSLSQPRTVTLL